MRTVQALRDHEHAALDQAVTAFLATLGHPESRGTRRVYASTLRALRAEFDDAACGVPEVCVPCELRR